MRKTALFILPLIVTCFVNSLIAQSDSLIICDKNFKKLSFPGKAPFPWAIDGGVSDWHTILGPGTKLAAKPYYPPLKSAFNWSMDGKYDQICQYPSSIQMGTCNGPTLVDFDYPKPQRDLQFLAFIHDRYNVFFYFRRLSKGSTANSFYYFCDINADGYMNDGEPVFHATFNADSVSSLTLGSYVADTTTVKYYNETFFYVPGKGNEMVAPFSGYHDSITAKIKETSTVWREIEGWPMRGKVKDIFNSKSIPGNMKLDKNEIFAAAITEGGSGVELAIPWRFLKYWSGCDIKDSACTKSLNPGDIFFYHVSIQSDDSDYSAAKVVDNAGSCCHGVATSGNVAIGDSISTTELIPAQSYKFKLLYTNKTNAPENVDGSYFATLKNFQKSGGKTLNSNDFKFIRYPDYNCNGRVDTGEVGIKYQVEFNTDTSEVYFIEPDPSIKGTGTGQDPNSIVAPPFGKSCFIAKLSLPSNKAVLGGTMIFEVSAVFNITIEFCDSGGGRVINPVGSSKTKLGARGILSSDEEDSIIENSNDLQAEIYPNPNHGSFTVHLSADKENADIILYDLYGRIVQHHYKINANDISISNVNKGYYFLKILFQGGETITKKIVVE